MRRRGVTTRHRLAAFLAAKGRCQRYGWVIHPGKRWELDHVMPLALGGRDEPSNWQVLCAACHSHKTRRTDIPAIAKATRVRAKHLGAWQPTRVIRGGRRSRWKRKIDGTVVRR